MAKTRYARKKWKKQHYQFRLAQSDDYTRMLPRKKVLEDLRTEQGEHMASYIYKGCNIRNKSLEKRHKILRFSY